MDDECRCNLASRTATVYVRHIVDMPPHLAEERYWWGERVTIETVSVGVVLDGDDLLYIVGEIGRDVRRINRAEWLQFAAYRRYAECDECGHRISSFNFTDPQWVTYAKEHDL